jgi:hypothetical protein
MSLDQYRTAMHNQHEWTQRAQHNRCLKETRWRDFTKTPLAVVLPSWRDDHLDYAKNRHHRAQSRPGSCFRQTFMDWYYASGARCVREHEGAWTSNTGNGYYGGFQADMNFQAAYNPGALRAYGTADRWPIIEQIEMAYNGWRARGWYPWPNTARACGLL